MPDVPSGTRGENDFLNQKVFVNHNRKALTTVETSINLIYTFFNADPKKSSYNHIITIPTAQRSEDNGFANFRFDMCNMPGKILQFNTRVETCVFQENLIIETSKVQNLLKSDLLIFPSPNGVYMSRQDQSGKHSWLTNEAYFNQCMKDWGNGVVKMYNYYDFVNLLTHGQVYELVYREDDNKLVIHDNNNYMIPDTSEFRRYIMTKSYNDYHIDTSHITQVQYDGRQARTLFWCTGDEQFTSRSGSSTKISLYLETLSTLDYKSIYQRLNRAYNNTIKTGKAHCAKIPFNGNGILNAAMLDKDGKNIIIYTSDRANFDVIENAVKENATADMKAYQTTYQAAYRGEHTNKLSKVTQWLKRNPNSTDYPKKWDAECLEIAKQYLLKHSV